MIYLTEKKIYGKKIRTSNSSVEEIITLWSQVPEMNLKGDVYALYSNYESNFKGAYDLLIGTETAPFSDDTVLCEGHYLEIPIPESTIEGVAKAWQMIWDDAELEEQRSYTIDVEHYKSDGSIAIYLSLKNDKLEKS